MVAQAILSPQTVGFDPSSRAFVSQYRGYTLRVLLPKDYPNHSDTARIDIYPRHDPSLLKCNDVVGDILPGEYMLLPLCMAFKEVLDRTAPPPPPPPTAPPVLTPPPLLDKPMPMPPGAMLPLPSVPPSRRQGGPSGRGGSQNTPQRGGYQNTNNNFRGGSGQGRGGSGGHYVQQQAAPLPGIEPFEKIYNRLISDPIFKHSDFDIGCVDAEKNFTFVPFAKYSPQVIPFANVTYIRYKQKELIWAKSERLDIVEGLAQRLTKESRGVIPMPTTSEESPIIPASLPVLPFKPLVGSFPMLEPLAYAPFQNTGKEPEPVSRTFSVLTWNILFNLFDEKNNLRSEERLPLQFKALEQSSADIIALQEVTPDFLVKLRETEWVKTKYNVTLLPDDVSSGQVILTKFKIHSSQVLRLSMQKHAVVLRLVSEVGKRCIMLVNVHLISDHAQNATSRRLQELAAIGKQFATEDDIILLGDFNFGDHDIEESTVPWGAFLDCWHILHGSEPGFTIDTDRNPLTKFTCSVRKESRRLDRIKMRGLLVPRDIHVCADQPQADGLYPSDHFAVRAVIVQEDAFVPFLPTVTLDQQCAVVILPPPHVWAQIDEMRKIHDKAFPRWMPHVNLLHPFVSLAGEQLNVVPRALAAIATRFVPFRVRLRDFTYIPSHSRSTLHLVAEALPPFESSMYRLYTMLASTYTMSARDNFAPHLTVGQFASAEVDKARAQFLTSWKSIVFDVSHIHLISRPTRDDAMQVLHSIPLGSFTDPPEFPAPLSVFPKREVSGDIPSEPLDPPPMVMEPLRFGSRPLEPYWPKDVLEVWMLSVSAMEYARTCPTHISQRGGMYHIPATVLSTYLQKWEAAIKDSDKVPFFIEEVRGEIFRLYVDVDFKSTAHTKIELEKTGFVPVLLAHTAACFPGANLAVCITDCHGKWDDKHHTDAVYKSGYRFYFQHIFVDVVVFRQYLDSLARVCEELLQMLPVAPRSVTWPEVVDTHSAIWERGRLIGTIKRRKNLWRRYKLFAFVTAEGDITRFIEKRTTETLLKVKPAREYTDLALKKVLRLLFATTLRLWETESIPDAVMHNNFCTGDTTYLKERVNASYIAPLLARDRRRDDRQSSLARREESVSETPTKEGGRQENVPTPPQGDTPAPE